VLEPGAVGIVAGSAQDVLFGTVPITGPFPVNAAFPVLVDPAVALSAEKREFLELHGLAAHQPQNVPVRGIVAVETPAPRLAVALYPYLLVEREFSFLFVGSHTLMATGAGIEAGGQHAGRRELLCSTPLRLHDKYTGHKKEENSDER
jgi:hypothetical protein